MAEDGEAEAVNRGMRALLARRSDEIGGGAAAVGWKVGINVPALQQHFGLDGPVVGYLTDSTVMAAGAPVTIDAWTRPALEVEVAVRVGADGAVAALAPALELVDLNLPFDHIEPILEGNIFHRGVIFGPEVTGLDVAGLDVAGLSVRVTRGDEQLAEGHLTEPPEVTVVVVDAFLHAHGEGLVPGDRIIAGSLITPLAVVPGDDLTVTWGDLGTLAVTFS